MRLTDAQWRMLERLSKEPQHGNRNPATLNILFDKKLVACKREWGVHWVWTITDAGRKALKERANQ